MKGIYQVVGSDGVVLAAIVAETEEQARATADAMGELFEEHYDIRHVGSF